MICPRKILAVGVVLASASLLAHTASVAPQNPQQPQPPQQSGDTAGTIRVPVNLVVVPVTVKDSRNQLVPDLQRNEFRIYEDGVEQRIALFSVEAYPLSIVVAVDDDLKAKTSTQVRKSLEALAGGISPSDEVALGRFDSFYTPLLDFTTDNDQLIAELKRMDLNTSFSSSAQSVTPGPAINGQPSPGSPGPAQIPNSYGKSTKHINDALHDAAMLLRARDPQRRRMIILISDGTNVKNNTHSYDETLRLLQSSNIAVYAIGLDSSVILRGTTILSKYAHATGGDVYYATRPSELDNFYSRVTEQDRHQYTIGYLPTDTDRGKLYHSIEVRIRRPGLTLLTRDGYYTVATP